MAGVIAYGCECPHKKCRERVRITEAEHTHLRKLGRVVSSRCQDVYGTTILQRGPGYAVVKSSVSRMLA